MAWRDFPNFLVFCVFRAPGARNGPPGAQNGHTNPKLTPWDGGRNLAKNAKNQKINFLLAPEVAQREGVATRKQMIAYISALACPQLCVLLFSRRSLGDVGLSN